MTGRGRTHRQQRRMRERRVEREGSGEVIAWTNLERVKLRTYEECAAILGITKQAACHRERTALIKLREAVRRMGLEEELRSFMR